MASNKLHFSMATIIVEMQIMTIEANFYITQCFGIRTVEINSLDIFVVHK